MRIVLRHDDRLAGKRQSTVASSWSPKGVKECVPPRMEQWSEGGWKCVTQSRSARMLPLLLLQNTTTTKLSRRRPDAGNRTSSFSVTSISYCSETHFLNGIRTWCCTKDPLRVFSTHFRRDGFSVTLTIGRMRMRAEANNIMAIVRVQLVFAIELSLATALSRAASPD